MNQSLVAVVFAHPPVGPPRSLPAMVSLPRSCSHHLLDAPQGTPVPAHPARAARWLLGQPHGLSLSSGFESQRLLLLQSDSYSPSGKKCVTPELRGLSTAHQALLMVHPTPSLLFCSLILQGAVLAHQGLPPPIPLSFLLFLTENGRSRIRLGCSDPSDSSSANG